MSRKAINSLQEESLKFGSIHFPVVHKNVQIRSWPVTEVVFKRIRIGYPRRHLVPVFSRAIAHSFFQRAIAAGY